MNGKYKSENIEIGGMDCPDCALRIEKAIGKLPGVASVQVNFMNSRLNVKWDKDKTRLKDIYKAIRSAGYSIGKSNDAQVDSLIVKGMDCNDEAIPIEKHLRSVSGIEDVKTNIVTGKINVTHRLSLNDIQKELNKIGFDAFPARAEPKQISRTFWKRYQITILTILSGIFATIGFIGHHLHGSIFLTNIFLSLAVLTGGFHIAWKGIREARNLTLGMNFLMSLAVVGAIILGEFTEAAMVVFLFALAQLLESFSVEKARRSIESLMDLAPPVASLKTAQGIEVLPVADIQVGDVIIIKPGERLPLDGMVTAGHSMVNQAPITGESMPSEKLNGSQVYAGTINQEGMLEIRVSRNSEDSTLARIIHMVEEAQAQKAPTQQFVEKFSLYYTPIVVTIALLLALVPSLVFNADFSNWIYRALVLLVISCPCALVISTPVTIVSALTNAARQGILIKGGTFLENFEKMQALAFDKTGTLTYGQPKVKAVIPINGMSELEVVQIAASIEAHSEHSIGKAILEYAKEIKLDLKSVQDFTSITGMGAKAKIEGKQYLLGNHRLFETNGWCGDHIHKKLKGIEEKQQTAVLIGQEEKVIAIIAIADEVRKNAKLSIKELHEAGIQKVLMLTGDNETTARMISRELEITDYRAELLPADKVTEVRKFMEEYQHVAMIGDGINDAPALAAASLGIAMGASASDTAMETADIALLSDDISKIAYLKRLSHKTVNIIKENIAIALLLKGMFFALAIPGIATLWMAVFADMGASLIVIFNGLRALRLNTSG